ncbi:hypothetical protein [Aquimarina spongiae]|uniref:Uncharacterized protein n=1 Tax=Aquimarina spongiae TaxID=570521 RepID=A0A1M6C9C0_9FLAO|nr:hypothetical protein [Aquimarina spongiae]SHI57576.1 hypothetical protein SAMN04488508_1028 [Aquimarina spongiae]
MTKLLHYSFLLVFIFLSNLGFSQSSTPTFQIAHQHTHEKVSINTHLDADTIIVLLANLELEAEHNHCNDVSLLDIMSSEKEEDLNCLGGFCMDHTHFHKRGLNIKSRRQLFRYFVKISC